MDIITCAFLTLLFPVTSTANIVSFWHVTDFHYDFSYSGRDLSCRQNVTNHGKYGDFWCDAPWKLIQSSVETMANIKPDVDFILWTGDSILHTSDDHLSFEINDAILGNLTNLLTSTFPNKTIYATFGNHDYFPNGQFPPNGNKLYRRTLEKWKHWINDDTQHDNFLKGAYYTVKTRDGMRIIALNTNLYYTSNKVTSQLDDPADQFAWLEAVLINATSNNERVLVTAHIPPGLPLGNSNPWFYNKYNKRLSDILLKYSHVIKGLHFGHEHHDTFRIYYKSANPVMGVYCAPSVTPWRYGNRHNPGVRLVEYDRATGRHLNIIQYYMDLIESNQKGAPQWTEEYNFTRDNGLFDVSPSSLDSLVNRMKTADNLEVKNHFKWRDLSVPDDAERPTCDEDCRKQIVCGIRNVDKDRYHECLDGNVGGAQTLFSSVLSCLCLFVITLALR